MDINISVTFFNRYQNYTGAVNSYESDAEVVDEVSIW